MFKTDRQKKNHPSSCDKFLTYIFELRLKWDLRWYRRQSLGANSDIANKPFIPKRRASWDGHKREVDDRTTITIKLTMK